MNVRYENGQDIMDRAVAEESGAFSEDELLEDELSEDDLEQVAGGVTFFAKK